MIIANTRKKLSGISNVGLLQQSEKVGMVQQFDKLVWYNNLINGYLLPQHAKEHTITM